MAKKTFYVRVNSGTIMEDPTVFDYEFEIRATTEELDQLQELFETTAEEELFVAQSAYSMQLNDIYPDQSQYYDEGLRKLYGMLHQLGTPETQKHIEAMNILKK